jgi:hypothetical protein
MHIFDGALARAWRDERIIFAGTLKKANAAKQLVHGWRVWPHYTTRLDGTARAACVVKPELGLCAATRRRDQLLDPELESA